MTDDYGCKVCGKHFEEEEDLKSHGKDDHPEVNEAYPEIFDKKEEQPAEEIDQQEDKPVQTHDDWQKELEGLQDEFATEQEKCAICNGEHPTAEHPVIEEGGAGSGPREGSTPALLPEQVARADDPNYNPFKSTPKSQLMQTDPYVTRTTENEEEPEEEKLPWIVDDQEGDNTAEEEGGADDPLKKVADLSENYKYMSRDNRINLFESLEFTQGDSAILSGLEWNELTRPIKVEASEAYIKEQEEPEEEAEETEEDEEDKAYEALYNIEKYHTSPDYKKKAITCNRCNEAFYNTNDRNIHFNDVHATEQEYKLPETCPYCNIEIHEPDNLDWHMQEEHGAHVPSQYTQTGLQGAMADTDFDSLESHKKAKEDWNVDDEEAYKERLKKALDINDFQATAIINSDYASAESHKKKAVEVYKTLEVGGISQTFDTYEEMMEAYKNFPEGTWQYSEESYKKASETSIYGSTIDDHFKEEYVMDQDGMYKCEHCGAWLDVHNIGGFSPEEVAKHHLETEHGITEASGARVIKPDDPDYEKEMAQIDAWNDLGASIKAQGLSKDELKKRGILFLESYGDDIKKERDELAKFINIASIENPMNIYGDQKRLEELDAVLDSIANEEEDVELVPDKGEFLNMMRDVQAPPEKAEEDGYVDDSDNAKENYVCDDCDEEFNSDTALQEHQYSYYHGDYKDDSDGEDMPRNVMGGQ